MIDQVMIDIETMGTAPGSAIVSIGAVAFDLKTAESSGEKHWNVSLQSSLNVGLTVDQGAIDFWMKQPDKARECLYTPTPIPLLDALSKLRGFITSHKVEGVWANGSNFDLSLLRAAYSAFDTRPPWHYRKERDMRTVTNLARAYGFKRTVVEFTGLIPHNPVHDCLKQIRVLTEVIHWLRCEGPLKSPLVPYDRETDAAGKGQIFLEKFGGENA